MEYAKRDPDYKAKVTDSVVRFLNSGEWGDVKDLHHYDIIDLKRDKRMLDAYLRDITGLPSGQAAFEKAVKQLSYLIARGIKNKGIKPKPFFDKVLQDGRINKLSEQVSNLISKEIIVNIQLQ
ncbi:MAG: hypothetical protein EBR82_87535 [Caulobacteraceae bacterium]|nr:hypothetical protein [Caulobacteraceae bacterium]